MESIYKYKMWTCWCSVMLKKNVKVVWKFWNKVYICPNCWYYNAKILKND